LFKRIGLKEGRVKKKALTLKEFQKKFPNMDKKWFHHYPFKKAKKKKMIHFSQSWLGRKKWKDGKNGCTCLGCFDERAAGMDPEVNKVKTYKRTGQLV
jgi:hypothetical protein